MWVESVEYTFNVLGISEELQLVLASYMMQPIPLWLYLCSPSFLPVRTIIPVIGVAWIPCCTVPSGLWASTRGEFMELYSIQSKPAVWISIIPHLSHYPDHYHSVQCWECGICSSWKGPRFCSKLPWPSSASVSAPQKYRKRSVASSNWLESFAIFPLRSHMKKRSSKKWVSI